MIPLYLNRQNIREPSHYIGLQIDLISQPRAIINRLNNGSYVINYQQDRAAMKRKMQIGNLSTPPPLCMTSFIHTSTPLYDLLYPHRHPFV